MARSSPASVSETELAMLQVLWERGEATRRQVADKLYPGGGESHYATVQKLWSAWRRRASSATTPRRGPGFRGDRQSRRVHPGPPPGAGGEILRRLHDSPCDDPGPVATVVGGRNR